MLAQLPTLSKARKRGNGSGNPERVSLTRWFFTMVRTCFALSPDRQCNGRGGKAGGQARASTRRRDPPGEGRERGVPSTQICLYVPITTLPMPMMSSSESITTTAPGPVSASRGLRRMTRAHECGWSSQRYAKPDQARTKEGGDVRGGGDELLQAHALFDLPDEVGVFLGNDALNQRRHPHHFHFSPPYVSLSRPSSPLNCSRRPALAMTYAEASRSAQGWRPPSSPRVPYPSLPSEGSACTVSSSLHTQVRWSGREPAAMEPRKNG